ncbi:MAG: ShlB/FhaC/HecB family hemolysin secretion/activation protein [Pseudomonadota bacterium]
MVSVRALGAGAAVALFLSAPLAQGQTAGERAVEGERVRAEQERERLRRSLEDGDIGVELAPAAPTGPGETDAVCFPIDAIEVSGVAALPPAVIDAIAAPYAQSCLGETAIGALLAAIDGAYRERGFITSRAYVPPQDLRRRALSIEIVEGFIEEVTLTVDGEARDDVWSRLRVRAGAPFAEGEILNLRDIEQGLDQFSAPKSATASVDLQPGETTGGTVVALKLAEEDRFRGFVTLESEEPEELGLTRARLGLEADNLLQLNESYQLFLSSTGDATSAGGGVELPWGSWSFAASGSYSDEVVRLTPVSDLVTLTAQGGVEARYLLYRDARNKTSITGALRHRQSERFINTAELTPQKLTTLRGGLSHEHRGDGYVVFADIGLSSGVPLFGGDRDPEGLEDVAPRAEFQKLDASLTGVLRLGDHFQLYASAFGQKSNVEVLRSEEQLSIGGWSSVRGFDGFGFTGDEGAFIRNEISAGALSVLFEAPDEAWWLDALQPFIFADAGYARSGALERGETLVGFGGGVRIDADPFEVSATVAYGASDGTAERDSPVQALVALTWQVF